MGKKVTWTSLKVSRTIEKKQLFSNLINVLKPKVYITDSSRFMMLVQELTGNGSSSSSRFSICTGSPSSSSSNGCSSTPVFSPLLIDSEVEKKIAPAIHVTEQGCSSIDDLLSFDSLKQYHLDDQTYSDTLDRSTKSAWEADMSFGEMSRTENLYFENPLPVMETERSIYQDLESWLLETDQETFQYQNGNDGIGSIGAHEQEVDAFNLDDHMQLVIITDTM